jgi:hypothetical protein
MLLFNRQLRDLRLAHPPAGSAKLLDCRASVLFHAQALADNTSDCFLTRLRQTVLLFTAPQLNVIKRRCEIILVHSGWLKFGVR